MTQLKLKRTTKVSGTNEHVNVVCEILEETETLLKVNVSEDVLSELKTTDWIAGDVVDIPKIMIESIGE